MNYGCLFVASKLFVVMSDELWVIFFIAIFLFVVRMALFIIFKTCCASAETLSKDS